MGYSVYISTSVLFDMEEYLEYWHDTLLEQASPEWKEALERHRRVLLDQLGTDADVVANLRLFIPEGDEAPSLYDDNLFTKYDNDSRFDGTYITSEFERFVSIERLLRMYQDSEDSQRFDPVWGDNDGPARVRNGRGKMMVMYESSYKGGEGVDIDFAGVAAKLAALKYPCRQVSKLGIS